MNKLKTHITKKWKKALSEIPEKKLEDIYVFSFYVYDDEDDPRKPTLTIGYNTKSNFIKEQQNASDEYEAKWNYAFFLQNEIEGIGLNDEGLEKEMIKEWIESLALDYTDEEFDEGLDTTYEKCEKITNNFVKILIEVVQETHELELTKLPILIHELEYYEEIRDQNILANGAERVSEFVSWLNNEWYME